MIRGLSEINPKISVIVPIHDVDKYLAKCLDSLMNQTMDQIEIILIDDGSTDESGNIADKYSRIPQFKVFHTPNRGLSAARNKGVREAKAEWIMFVDGDDWVDNRFCELPYRVGITYGADMVIFEAHSIKKYGTYLRIESAASLQCKNIDNNDAIVYGGIATWNKLYKKELFRNIEFPEGRVFEDVATTHKLIHSASKIIKLEEILYFHVIRKNSISQCKSIKNKKDGLHAAIERSNDLLSYGFKESDNYSILCIYAMGVLASMKPCNDQDYIRAKEIVNNLKKLPKELSMNQKAAFFAWKFNPGLFYLLSKLTGRLHIETSSN